MDKSRIEKEYKKRRLKLVSLLEKSSGLDETARREILGLFDEAQDSVLQRYKQQSTLPAVSALDDAGDAIFVHDLEGYILSVNPVACRRLGFEREELLGTLVKGLTRNSSQERYEQHRDSILTHGTYTFETVYQARDGSIVPVEVNARLVEYHGQQTVLSIARDITARKEAESIMLEHKQFLSAVLENLPVGLCVKNVKNNYSFSLWNARMEQLTRLKSKDMVGTTDYDHFSESVADNLRRTDEAVMAGGKVVDAPVVSVPVDRGGFKAHTIKVPTYDASGQPDFLIEIVEDITERLRAEIRIIETKKELESRVVKRTAELQLAHDRMKEAEEYYRALYEQAAEAIFVFDSEGTFLQANPAAQDIFGYQQQDLVTMHPMQLLHPEEIDSAPAALKAIRKGEIVQMELRVKRKDGGFADVVLSAKVIGRDHILATMWDISDRKVMERELLAAKVVAEKANEAKSEFLANMSHEIRTPLSGILGMTNMVLSMNIDEKHREYVMGIRAASMSLLDIINDILDFSKIEANMMEINLRPFSLRSRVESLRDTFSIQAAAKDIELRIAVSNQVPDRLVGDGGRLGQVLSNLLSNAIKFTESGMVGLSVNLQEERENEVRLSFLVEDTGVGIPENKREQLFEVFRQLDPGLTKHQPGTGLGLAISRKLVQMMGGEIDLHSIVGSGSRFFFSLLFELPASKESRDSIEAPSINVQGRSVRVLLAEDNLLNQEFLIHFLKEGGHKVWVAENGNKVLELLEAKPFDIVLMDVQMPQMDGLQATQKIRSYKGTQYDSNIPIIALTAYAMKGDKERMLKAGMNDYLSKPVDMEQLFELIRELTAAKP